MKKILRYFISETAIGFAIRWGTCRHVKDCMVVSEWLYPSAWRPYLNNRELWPEYAPHRIAISFVRILPRLFRDEISQAWWRVLSWWYSWVK